MKKSILILLFIVGSCSDKNKSIEVSSPIKIVHIDKLHDFEVVIADDGHEYEKFDQFNSQTQWIHYPGCNKCEIRLYKLENYIYNKK